MPGFDVEGFPFILSTGKDSLNLVNVKNAAQIPLIFTQSNNLNLKEPPFFTNEEDTIHLHFNMQ